MPQPREKSNNSHGPGAAGSLSLAAPARAVTGASASNHSKSHTVFCRTRRSAPVFIDVIFLMRCVVQPGGVHGRFHEPSSFLRLPPRLRTLANDCSTHAPRDASLTHRPSGLTGGDCRGVIVRDTFTGGNETDGWYYDGSTWMQGMAQVAGVPASGKAASQPFGVASAFRGPGLLHELKPQGVGEERVPGVDLPHLVHLHLEEVRAGPQVDSPQGGGR